MWKHSCNRPKSSKSGLPLPFPVRIGVIGILLIHVPLVPQLQTRSVVHRRHDRVYLGLDDNVLQCDAILYYILTLLCYIMLYHIISYHMILYYIILYCIILYYIILYYIILYYIILYYIILYYIILYYVILYYIISYCIKLYDII